MGEDGEWVTVQGRRRQRRLESEEDRVNLQGDKNPHLGVNQDRNIRGAEFNRVLKSKAMSFFSRDFLKPGDQRSCGRCLRNTAEWLTTSEVGDKPCKVQQKSDTKEFRKESHARTENQKRNVELSGRQYCTGLSYKDAMLDRNPPQIEIINLSVKEEQVTRLRNCWVGIVHNIDILRNIWNLFKDDGLGECAIRYMDGLSILCEWKSEEKARECLKENKENLKNWMLNIAMWDERH
ncbi:hypothetical protein Tco_1406485 [Tanacetum coccineum]